LGGPSRVNVMNLFSKICGVLSEEEDIDVAPG
jgi:hypothetical protein